MSIPISDIVKINPGVQSAGSQALTLNAVVLTKSTKIAAGNVTPFTSVSAVTNIFGIDSVEEKMAKRYFAGYDNSTIKPSLIYFSPYNDVARAAWLRSGSWAGKEITAIQALGAGTLIVTVNGIAFTSASINLALSSSFTDAAARITAGFSGTGAPVCTWESASSTFLLSSPTGGSASTIGLATGTLATSLLFTAATGAYISPGADADTASAAMDLIKSKTQNWAFFSTTWEPGLGSKKLFADWANNQNSRYAYIVWDSDQKAIVNLDLVQTTPILTPASFAAGIGGIVGMVAGAVDSPIPVVTSGNFTVTLRMGSGGGSGKKVMAAQAGCFEIGKAAGGVLLYAKYGSVTMTTSQALSSTEKLIELAVSETGANLFYDGVLVANSATGATAAGCTYNNKLNVFYSANGVDNFSGVIYDVAVYNATLHTGAYTPSPSLLSGNEANLVALWPLSGTLKNTTVAFGEYASLVNYDSVMAVYNNYDLAAFALGMLASIDFNRANSRITAKFKTQSGLLPTVTGKTEADKLIAGGYNFYGAYGENNLSENLFHDGQMFGKWLYIDLFANQVYLNAQLQGAILNLFMVSPSVGYTQSDFGLIRSAMQGPINDALNFGSIRAGVQLSDSQKSELNQAAGLSISTTIENQGYYLQILDPGAQVRAARGSPVINFWYTDGGAVHKINVSSIDVV